MKFLAAIVLAVGLGFGTSYAVSSWPTSDEQSCCDAADATCTGAANCRACKSCSSCKHCAKNGGSCGVCANASPEKP